ncbi:hypothetical protein [Peribacillus butanolivorans]|uniref:hypothetical protein n=1 Tax=Peribacillus butanolivorans TaxID=421767 RepID=UPI0037FF3BAF
MEVIEWYAFEETDEAKNIMEEITQDDFDSDEITTKNAITVCKAKLSGDYNALLIRNMEEYLSDAEVYVLTWDGEASDGGDMFRLNASNLEEIVKGTIFGGTGK